MKAKLEFRFRETSSDNTTDKFKLMVHVFSETTCLLTFHSPPFRTVVRSPQRGKFKLLKEQMESHQTIAVPFENSETEANKRASKRKNHETQVNFASFPGTLKKIQPISNTNTSMPIISPFPIPQNRTIPSQVVFNSPPKDQQ